MRLGDSLAEAGFRFLKSGPKSRRVGPIFSHNICFQTSYSNVRGRYVALWIQINVRSQQLLASRRAHPLPGPAVDDFVAGVNLGQLMSDGGWLEFNLAQDPERVLSQAIECIEQWVLPYFERFNDPQHLVAEILAGSATSLEPQAALECCLCFGTEQQATVCLSELLGQDPVHVQRYREYRRRYESEGMPEGRARRCSDQLARIALAYGLDPEGVAGG